MPSRRQSIQMTDTEMNDYLSSQKTLVIVSNGRDGYPHPMPMWFSRDEDGRFYCTTFGKSQKVLNWRRDAKATLLVESGLEYAELKGVVVYARCKVIDDPEEVKDTLLAVNTQGQTLDPAAKAKLRESLGRTAAKRVVLQFTPERYLTWDHSKLGGRY